jgi:phospholipid N-methyltransferase
MQQLRKKADFLKYVLRDRSIGAISVSSGRVVRDVIGRLPVKPKLLIEYGPGDGVITGAILSSLAADGRLYVVEPNKEFVEILKKIPDPRMTVIDGRAEQLSSEQLRQFQNADAVVASIPFSFLSTEERERVITDVHSYLSSVGKFIIFHQYSRLMRDPLRKIFRSVSVTFEPRNIFPCFIIEAQK